MKSILKASILSLILFTSCEKEKVIFCNPDTGLYTKQLELFPDQKQAYNFSNGEEITTFTKSNEESIFNSALTCFKNHDLIYRNKDFKIMSTSAYDPDNTESKVEFAIISNWFQTSDISTASTFWLSIEPNGNFKVEGNPLKLDEPRNKEMLQASVEIAGEEFHDVLEVKMNTGIIVHAWIQKNKGLVAFKDNNGKIWVRN